METDKKEFTITTYTENYLGVISRINNIFSRRRIVVENLNVGPCEVQGIKKFIIVINENEEAIKKLVNQIEKQVDVLEVHYHRNPCMTVLRNAGNY
ncbi:ACT domain-containing protein [Chryseobacterium sp. G0201]|uniref:ACT domain-containing protein n=1 Tax=Chryseobacterium sp. G0201 TaxID=2487065 RepID=UPI000F4DD8CE|nr:ACT domain-containing protein [Chryseobacterium sp. G0201]AZA54123.1 hypothetical protein EG348_14505 [Chryseobacterium sp. G0201]